MSSPNMTKNMNVSDSNSHSLDQKHNTHTVKDDWKHQKGNPLPKRVKITKLIVTPINMVTPRVTGNTKKAREDYKREYVNFNGDISPKWDDSKYNNAIVGDMFAFVHNIEDRFELFEIKGILNRIDRPDYWNIPEHRKRNVLILSKKIREDTWTRAKEEIGLPNWGILRGTCRTNMAESLFHNVDEL